MSPGRESPTIPSRYLPTETIFGTVVEIVRRLSSVTWESAARIQRSSSWIPTSVVITGPFLREKSLPLVGVSGSETRRFFLQYERQRIYKRAPTA